MKNRDTVVDAMKFILVTVMIFAHVVQILMPASSQSPVVKAISIYANLTSFSGFLFCFGYVSYIAYLSKPLSDVREKLVINFYKLLGTYYLSGVACVLLFTKTFNFQALIDILLLRMIPYYSEFLLSFAFLNLALAVFFEPIQKIIEHTWMLILVVVICAAASHFPYKAIHSVLSGVIIGTEAHYTFPLVQYFPFFICGAYIKKHGLRTPKTCLLISLFFLADFVGFYLQNGAFPSRFPPSFLWLSGSCLFILVYYFAAQCLPQKIRNHCVFLYVSKHSLLFLLFSNLIIFWAYYAFGRFILHNWLLFVAFAAVMAIVAGLSYLCDNRVKRY